MALYILGRVEEVLASVEEVPARARRSPQQLYLHLLRLAGATEAGESQHLSSSSTIPNYLFLETAPLPLLRSTRPPDSEISVRCFESELPSLDQIEDTLYTGQHLYCYAGGVLLPLTGLDPYEILVPRRNPLTFQTLRGDESHDEARRKPGPSSHLPVYETNRKEVVNLVAKSRFLFLLPPR